MERNNHEMNPDMQDLMRIFHALNGGKPVMTVEEYHRPRNTEEWKRQVERGWELNASRW